MGTAAQFHNGVSVNADSTFSRGNGAERECCPPASSWGAGDVEREGRLPGRIAARPDPREKREWGRVLKKI